MPILTQADYLLGDLRVRYQAPADKPTAWGLSIFPESMRTQLVLPREKLDSPAIVCLPAPWNETQAWEVDPLVQAHVVGEAYPGGYANGRTLRNSATTQALAVDGHSSETVAGRTVLRTTLRARSGLVFRHEITGTASGGLEVRTTVDNPTPGPLTLELLDSFSLGGISPFAAGDEPGRFRVHRFRSGWSAEGRHEARMAEELNLERSWTGHGARSERFGQSGSLPVNGWFPVVALEDVQAGVTWLAQLACPGSWHLEISHRADSFSLSGGGADQLTGEWRRTLQPGEVFAAPVAFLTAVAGSIEAACDRLVAWQRERAPVTPAVERTLPILFNEWCSSWGHPSHESLVRLADRLAGSGVTYLVIDDGWAQRPSDAFQQNGDWIVNRQVFPGGLRVTADAIRARGLVPGIWFEFEAINPGSKAWDETTHQLQRNALPLQVGNRRFWDFRDPWVHDYLSRRVTALLRDGGFGYLKVDCNDSVGPGIDGPESPGENLRRHLEGVQRFFAQLRVDVPGLVIENCASGGHRLEPSMMALTSMSSFSDAHETPDIPLIAANLDRLVWSAQKQIWAVLRPGDSLQRLSYSLAAGFLGRLCLSGDVEKLGEAAWRFTCEAITFYREVAFLVRDGVFREMRQGGESYQHPAGFQIVTVDAMDGSERLVIWHCFARAPGTLAIKLSAGQSWTVKRTLASQATDAAIMQDRLSWSTQGAWSGGVLWLRARA